MSGRRITTIVSGNIGPKACKCVPATSHNDYLNLLADWGTVGGVMVLAGMVVFGAGLLKTRKYVRPPENDFGRGLGSRFAFFLGAAAGLLALAVHSLVDFNLHIPANAILGVTLLALLSSNLRFATERYWLSARLPLKTLTTLALVMGGVYLSDQEWRQGHEQLWLARAEQLPDFSSARTAVLIKAFDAEPMNFETAYDIGEAYRLQSFKGGQNYEDLAKTAMQWYARGLKLDRYDGYDYLRMECVSTGWDSMPRPGRISAAPRHLTRMDIIPLPTSAGITCRSEDYAAARSWLARSMRLHWQDNVIGRSYLEICEHKLVENASGQSLLPAGF